MPHVVRKARGFTVDQTWLARHTYKVTMLIMSTDATTSADVCYDALEDIPKRPVK